MSVLKLKHTEELSNGASQIIDLEISIQEGVTVSYEVTNKLDSTVNEDVLKMFKSIVSELEQQNKLIKNS